MSGRLLPPPEVLDGNEALVRVGPVVEVIADGPIDTPSLHDAAQAAVLWLERAEMAPMTYSLPLLRPVIANLKASLTGDADMLLRKRSRQELEASLGRVDEANKRAKRAEGDADRLRERVRSLLADLEAANAEVDRLRAELEATAAPKPKAQKKKRSIGAKVKAFIDGKSK